MMVDAPEMAQPRRLLRFWRIVREGLPSSGRYMRYVLTMAPVLIGIFATTGAYLVLMPNRYQSEFSLILPGSGMGSSLNLESIGQAQTSASSAFSSSTLSPTENYKQLLSADVTLRAAARRAKEHEDSFPAPTIKLIDQTNLILVSISGKSPREAQDRADALRQAFLDADTCARERPARYRLLSRAAARDIARDFSVEPTVDALRRALYGD